MKEFILNIKNAFSFFHKDKLSVLNKTNKILLYFLLASLPLFLLPQVPFSLILQKGALLLSFLFLIFVLFSIFSIQNGKFYFRFSKSIVALALFFLYVLFAYLFLGLPKFSFFGISLNQWDTVFNSFLVLVLFFFILSLAQERRNIKDILYILVFSGALSSIIYYLFNVNLIGQSYLFAFFTGSLFVLGFFLLTDVKSRILKCALFLLELWFLFVLFLLKAKFILILSFLAMILQSVYYFSSKDAFKQGKALLYLSLALALVLAFFFFKIEGNIDENKIQMSFTGAYNLVYSEYSNSASKAIFGYAPAGFRYAFLEYKPIIRNLDLNRTEIVYGFSPFFDFLVDLGILGTVLFLLFIFYVFYPATKNLFSDYQKKERDLLFFSLFLVSFLFLIYFFAYPSDMLAFYLLIVYFALLSASLSSDLKPTEVLYSKNSKLLAGYVLVSFVVLALFVYSSVSFYKEENGILNFTKAKSAFASGNYDLAERYALYAFSFSKDDSYLRFVANLKAKELEDQIKKKKITKKDLEKKLSEIESLYKEAINLNPREYSNYLKLAILYDRFSFDDNMIKNAIFYYQKALSLNRSNADILFSLGKLFYNIKKYDTAKIIFEALKAYYPNQADIRLNLGLTYFALKDYKNALEELKAAKKLNSKLILDSAIKAAEEKAKSQKEEKSSK